MLKLWLWALAAFALSMFLCHGFKPSFLASVEQRNIEAAVGGDSFIIPETNLVNWAVYAGVRGGPTYRTTVHTTISETITHTTINSALANCPTNQVVVIPDGTHTITGEINLQDYPNRTLRGASTNAILELSTGASFKSGFALGYEMSTYNGLTWTNTISSTALRGAASVTCVSNVANLQVGDLMVITESNDVGYVTPYSYESEVLNTVTYGDEDNKPDGHWLRGQIVEVTNISGAVVGFYPPLFSDFTNDNRMISYADIDPWGGFGVENMVIKQTAAGPDVSLNFVKAKNCWVTNVIFEMYGSESPILQFTASLGSSVLHCGFRRGVDGNLLEAILSWVNNQGLRVEDCWFAPLHSSVSMSGRGGGHALINNYFHSYSNSAGAYTALKQVVYTHAGHPQFLLLEGNKLLKVGMDNIHGSSSHWTLYRNYIPGTYLTHASTFGDACVQVDAANYHASLVGNVFGTNGMIERWSYARNATIGEIGGSATTPAILMFNSSGYATNVPYLNEAQNHTDRAGNWNYMSNAVDAAWSGTQSNSLIYASKPGYFGNLAWPPIGPDTTGYHTNLLPAEARFLGIAIP